MFRRPDSEGEVLNVERGFKRHLRWIVPLLLIPFSVFVFLSIALIAMPSKDGAGVDWLVVVAGLCAAVAPIVFTILTITGAQKTYRRSRVFEMKMHKRNEAWARKMERQIVSEGGPRCDFEARAIAKTHATHWFECLAEGEAIPSADGFNLNLEPGELLLDQYRAKYARFYGQNVTYSTGGVFAMGSPLFVAGAMIGATVGKANARAQAQRMAAAQWREIQYVDVLVTDRRLIIPVGGRTLSFYYSGVVAFYPELEAMTLTLDYGDNTEPLQIFSPGIAATSVLLVRQLKGVEGMRSHPALKTISDQAITA